MHLRPTGYERRPRLLSAAFEIFPGLLGQNHLLSAALAPLSTACSDSSLGHGLGQADRIASQADFKEKEDLSATWHCAALQPIQFLSAVRAEFTPGGSTQELRRSKQRTGTSLPTALAPSSLHQIFGNAGREIPVTLRAFVNKQALRESRFCLGGGFSSHTTVKPKCTPRPTESLGVPGIFRVPYSFSHALVCCSDTRGLTAPFPLLSYACPGEAAVRQTPRRGHPGCRRSFP